MKNLFSAAAMLSQLTFAPVALAATRSPQAEVVTTARTMLDAYAAGDRQAVAAGLDREVHVYGSDRREVAATPAGFMTLYDTDQKLWRGAASFGPMQNVSLVSDGRLAGLFFDREFTVGGRTTVVRFATVWRLEKAGWKLVQSANVVPTFGQSGAELLGVSGK